MTAPWVDDAHVAAVIAELEAGWVDQSDFDGCVPVGSNAAIDGCTGGTSPIESDRADHPLPVDPAQIDRSVLDPAGGAYDWDELTRLGVPEGRGPHDDLSHVEHLAAAAAAMTPGPEAAHLVASLVSPGTALSPAARVDVLLAVERLARWLSAVSSQLLVDHVGPVELPNLAPADWSGVEQRGRVAEVAVACETSENHVMDRWALARALLAPGAALGLTGQALRAGEVSSVHARVLVETTAGLAEQDVRLVQARVLDKAVGRSPSRFRQICRRAVVRVDPDAATRRHHAAVAQRAVTWWPEPDGMARLQVLGAAPEVMAIHGVVDLLAGPRTPGDDRLVGARRFDALLELCLAAVAPRTPSLPVGPAAATESDAAKAPDATAAAGAATTAATTGPALDPHDSALTGDGVVVPRCGVKPEVQAQVVVDLPTLLGLADHPGELRGYGPIPAGLAREWLGEATTWRRLVTDPVSGHLLDYGPVVRLAPPRLRDFVLARDGTCTFPGCTRRAAGRGVEIDHHPPWRPGGTGGSASAAQTGALCAHHHHLRTHGGWILHTRDHGTSTWSSPSGREHRSAPGPVLLEGGPPS